MPDVNLLLAFAAGVLGFLSPCIVPLIPGYLSFVSGSSLAELSPADGRQHRVQVVLGTVVFVIGFASVFTALGASATVLGNVVLQNRVWLSRIGGGAIIVLGLSLWGVVRIPGVSRERRVRVPRPRALLGGLPVGIACGFAWTHCTGPPLVRLGACASRPPGWWRGRRPPAPPLRWSRPGRPQTSHWSLKPCRSCRPTTSIP